MKTPGRFPPALPPASVRRLDVWIEVFEKMLDLAKSYRRAQLVEHQKAATEVLVDPRPPGPPNSRGGES